MTDQYRCPKCQRLLFKVEIKQEMFKDPEIKIIYRAKGLEEYKNYDTDCQEVICTKCKTVSAIAKRKLIEVGNARLRNSDH